MRNREHEIILGAVVFAAAIILVLGTVWLSEQYAGAAGGYRIDVRFDSVPGLQKGDPVTFRGVWVGKVLSIALDNGKPIVSLGFAEVENLPNDSQFLIKSEGLLGGQMIEIQIGTSEQLLSDGAAIQGVSGSGVEQVMAETGMLVGSINTAMSQITDEKNLVHLGNALAQVDTTTQRLSVLLAENREHIAQLLDSLALASGDASGILNENREDLRTAVKNLAVTMEQFAKFSTEIETTSVVMRNTFDNLDQISRQIQKGHGTLGRLVQDEAVYEHLDRTLTSIDSLLEDIKRDPTRYFRFSVF